MRVFGILGAERAATAQLGREVIGCWIDGRKGLDDGRRGTPIDRDEGHDEHRDQGEERGRAEDVRPSQHRAPQLPLNMVTLPGW